MPLVSFSALENNICLKWRKSKQGPNRSNTRSTLTDGLISTCQTLTYPNRFLLNHAQMSIPEQCHSDLKFSVRISLNQFSSCSNVTLLQTGVKHNSGKSDSESCSEQNRLLKCSLVQDYSQMNTYCEYECKCSLVSSGQQCTLYINLHPNSRQKHDELCEIVFISKAKVMHATTW